MNIIEKLKELNLTISTAESLTGGMIASKICNISGASNYFKGGIVSYTKQAKCSLLNLNMLDIEKYGVYSYETVISMAKSIKEQLNTDISISTSGVAGPNDDENVKAGTVYFCFIIKDKIITEKKCFNGSRNDVRIEASEYAINKIINLL